jgi:hypothetical protein
MLAVTDIHRKIVPIYLAVLYSAKQAVMLNDWMTVGNGLKKILRKPSWSILMYYPGNYLEEPHLGQPVFLQRS